MNISFKWLKDYIDIDITPEELAEKLTSRGIAVEKVEYLNKGITKVVVAKVLEAKKHPDADKLNLCKVTTNGEDEIQVVCGAKNVRTGLTVAFAMVGATLPEGVKIKKAKLRGIESFGMICSAKELGMNEDTLTPDQKQGILELDESIPLGTDIVNVLHLDDCVLELDLTPNRSDCLSVINVAREAVGIVGKDLQMPSCKVNEIDKSIEGLIDIDVLDTDLCPRYTARIIENVKIGPSPLWLRHKLVCAGVRPINNIVDITNFVMLEMGQPLHAFDYDSLDEKKIIVRKANKDEKIVSLDGVERSLEEDMLLISDSKKGIAIAGVMGGENTEVEDGTTTVLLESAYFNPHTVRRTSTRLGLRSESSIRFEKGINIETVNMALDRAAELMEQLAEGKVLKGYIDKYADVKERTHVKLRLAKVNKVLGTDLTDSQIKDILESLNFVILDKDDTSVTFEVPPYRPDVTIEEDLIEEVVRCFGYDNIPVTLPYGNTNPGGKTEDQKFRDNIIDSLVDLGLHEVINFSFINNDNFDKLLLAEEDERREVVKIMNPLSEEQGVMRTTILPSLLNTIKRNVNRRNEDLGLFELGKVYYPKGFPKESDLPVEEWVLGIALRGKLTSDWQDKGEEVDFYYLKGIVDYLFEKLNIGTVTYEACTNNNSFHPGRCANVFVNDVFVGVIGEIHPQVCENYDLPIKNYVAEINVEKLLKMNRNTIVFKSLPKYPATTRDLAVVLKEDVPASKITEEIKAQGGELLRDVTLFDVYQGDQILEGNKSLAFSLVFQASDRTLVDEEINTIYEKIQTSLAEKFAANLRA